MSNKSPIIFLNIDGVLISEEYIMGLAKNLDLLYRKIENKYIMNFEIDKINILKDIIDKTNAYIVIASSWTKDNNLEDIKKIFKEYELDKRVIDITPYLCKRRGYEVKEWLNKNINNFEFLDKEHILIIDDQKIGCLEDYHIKVNPKIGITTNDSKQIIKRLKR